MKRVIKFRGKQGDKWLFGSLVQSADMVRFAILDPKGETYEECEVDPDTVGQFTGLHDKNGKEIYEGDILKVDYLQEPQYVSYVSDGFVCGAIRSINYPLHQVYRDCCIIGNIHDNAELLKGELS